MPIGRIPTENSRSAIIGFVRKSFQMVSMMRKECNNLEADESKHEWFPHPILPLPPLPKAVRDAIGYDDGFTPFLWTISAVRPL